MVTGNGDIVLEVMATVDIDEVAIVTTTCDDSDEDFATEIATVGVAIEIASAWVASENENAWVASENAHVEIEDVIAAVEIVTVIVGVKATELEENGIPEATGNDHCSEVRSCKSVAQQISQQQL